SYSSISFDQWSRYYNIESKRLALLSHRGVNHKITDRRIHSYWGNDWMRHHGLSTDHGSDWIIKIFRKHKSSFSYLQHFSCWLGVRGDSLEIILHDELKKVLQYSESTNKTKKIKYSNNDEKRIEYRKEWISCLKKYEYLCDIRNDKNGRRFYSWLYRYDFSWLEKNKPVQKINKECFRNVDWKKRDRSVVRYLIDMERSIWQRLDGRRRSMSWYCQQLKVKSFYSLKVEKMPLCRLFFIKYAETVEEYQARRLAYHLSCMITAKRGEVNSYELYKKAGLSAKTIYQSVDIIIKKDI
ncbi:TnsD family Tn7-like transposition protein, partial [Halomonas sp. MES3-P3E]|uniref:TnsD family Tn7-like transposition protein n=1 Tax=Halomonas sp. MES3-P3E TaxID=2058321 RepID=UPI0018E3DFCC